jgi:hypothetical protein
VQTAIAAVSSLQSGNWPIIIVGLPLEYPILVSLSRASALAQLAPDTDVPFKSLTPHIKSLSNSLTLHITSLTLQIKSLLVKLVHYVMKHSGGKMLTKSVGTATR